MTVQTNILNMSLVNDSEKYTELAKIVGELEDTINQHFEEEKLKKQKMEQDFERFDRIKHLIDTQLDELKRYFDELDAGINEIKVSYG